MNPAALIEQYARKLYEADGQEEDSGRMPWDHVEMDGTRKVYRRLIADVTRILVAEGWTPPSLPVRVPGEGLAKFDRIAVEGSGNPNDTHVWEIQPKGD